jgi:hypothetical protein
MPLPSKEESPRTIAVAESTPKSPFQRLDATEANRGGPSNPVRLVRTRTASPSEIRFEIVATEALVTRRINSLAFRHPLRAARPSEPSDDLERSEASAAAANLSASAFRPILSARESATMTD